MMRNVGIVLKDFVGLCRVCGWMVGLRWLLSIATNARGILQQSNLRPADEALGSGPFSIRFKNLGFMVAGKGGISGIREMYVRDVYLHNDALRISDGDTVLDLGANVGNFTNAALAHGPNVRVVAVEPSAALNAAFRKSVALNAGFLERSILIRAFVGLMGAKQVDVIEHDPQYSDAPWITEDQLIERGKLTRVDFLKCDIEGGEFELLAKDSRLLAMTTTLAVEIHAFAGDVEEFLNNLRALGFSVLAVKRDSDGSCTALARRE